MKQKKEKKLKLIFPLWRGGNNVLYFLGSQILNFLFGKNEKFIEKKIKINLKNNSISNISKINNYKEIIKELMLAKKVITKFGPDKMITLGGDCLISQQPINYFQNKYNDFCVIWFDAHPDISTPKVYNHAHAMVLSNLFGENKNYFSNLVDNPLKHNQVIYFGLNLEDSNLFEQNKVNQLNLKNISVNEIKSNNFCNFDNWLKQNKFKNAYIHIDLDVLDPKIFHSLYFTNSKKNLNNLANIAKGSLTFEMLNNSIIHIKKHLNIVGVSIAELLPWDFLELQELLANLKNLI